MSNPRNEAVSLTLNVRDRTKMTVRPLEPLGQWLILISIPIFGLGIWFMRSKKGRLEEDTNNKLSQALSVILGELGALVHLRGLNQRIERSNGEIRDREIVMRGLDHDKTAQIMVDGMRINHNFIRPHMGLDGKTPAQVAGLDLQLEGIRWKELIKQAIQSRVQWSDPHDLA